MGKHLYAVGNRTHEKAVTFAEKYGVQKVYDDFQEMFHDPDVDVIYITTPHNTHIEFAREALAGGKHVLCEKSVMLNSRELAEAIALAEEHHVVFAAVSYTHLVIVGIAVQTFMSAGVISTDVCAEQAGTLASCPFLLRHL